MANFKLPSGAVSKRFLVTSYGFNQKHLRTLLDLGVLTPLGPGIAVSSLTNLRENQHYVVCKECGSRQAAITPRHIKMCSGLSFEGYTAKHPQAPLVSSVTDKARAKSEAQRKRQSDVLKARFRTALGEITRRQISESSKRLMQTDYREKASKHLRKYVEGHKGDFAELSRRRWKDPEFRAKMSQIHRERSILLGTLIHARGFITRTFSKPHQKLESALVRAGVQGLHREFLIGYYRVDEAVPSSKVAIEVDGCYWHGCSVCGFSGHPITLKLDQRKTTYLLNQGWRVLRVPEHRVKEDLQKVVLEILEVLHG